MQLARLVLLSVLTTPCLAAAPYYCLPGGAIHIGDSMETVFAKCGVPQRQRKIQQTKKKQIAVIDWVYLKPLQKLAKSNHWLDQLSNRTREHSEDIILLRFNRRERSLRSIAVYGHTAAETRVCGHNNRTRPTVSVGQSMAQALANCGRPDRSYTRTVLEPRPTHTMYIWEYKKSPYTPMTSFKFDQYKNLVKID